MARESSRGVDTGKDKQLVQVTYIHKQLRSGAYMGITSSTCRMCSIKSGGKRTNAGVKISTQDRQQLWLDAFQRELQLSRRVSLRNVTFCQGGSWRHVHVCNVNSLAVRQFELNLQAVFIACRALDV